MHQNGHQNTPKWPSTELKVILKNNEMTIIVIKVQNSEVPKLSYETALRKVR